MLSYYQKLVNGVHCQNTASKNSKKEFLKKMKIAKPSCVGALGFWAKRTSACDLRAAEIEVCECAYACDPKIRRNSHSVVFLLL